MMSCMDKNQFRYEGTREERHCPNTTTNISFISSLQNWQAENNPDEYFMGLAIAMGERGRLTAPPNPWVGSVIVARDKKTVLGEGFHRKVCWFSLFYRKLSFPCFFVVLLFSL